MVIHCSVQSTGPLPHLHLKFNRVKLELDPTTTPGFGLSQPCPFPSLHQGAVGGAVRGGDSSPAMVLSTQSPPHDQRVEVTQHHVTRFSKHSPLLGPYVSRPRQS